MEAPTLDQPGRAGKLGLSRDETIAWEMLAERLRALDLHIGTSLDISTNPAVQKELVAATHCLVSVRNAIHLIDLGRLKGKR